MTRKLLLALVVTSLAFSGCRKLQMPGAKKQTETPQSSEVQSDPASETAAAAPAAPPEAGVPEAPSAPVIGNKDAAVAMPAGQQAAGAPEKKVVVDKNSQVVVLCYHRLEGKAGGQLSIEPALFEEQMQKIKDLGLTVISMQDFIAWRKGEKNIPPKCVLITIDDGYISSYDVGWPILKKYGYPFTMYVYLKYINAGGKSISWKQLEEMRDAGVDIGSHTISHLDLRRKPKNAKEEDYESWLKEELETSKKTIEDKLGIKVLSIAYPFGLHNEKVRSAVKAAGYEAGFTTYGQRLGYNSDPFALGRYDVTTKDARGHDSFSVAVSFEGMMAPDAQPGMAQDAAVSMVTQPMNGEITNNVTPTIKANLSTMGNVDPATVEMRVSGVGLVKAKYDPTSKTISYDVPKNQPLKTDAYTVIISAEVDGRKAETRWNFMVDPKASPASGADAPLPPRNRGR